MSANDLEDLDQLVTVNAKDPMDLLQSHVGIIKANVECKELTADDSPYSLSLRKSEFEEDKELDKFVKACERLVRSCPEYKIWCQYIRDILGFHVCEISGELHSQTTVEIHHHPINLYHMTKGVICQLIASGKSFCSFDVCVEVIEMHYQMRAPFCMILGSLHEKFHRGFLQLPMELVHGDYKYFLDHYLHLLEDEDAESITSRLGVNRTNCGWDGNYWLSERNGQ
jgi:hypothetical protein